MASPTTTPAAGRDGAPPAGSLSSTAPQASFRGLTPRSALPAGWLALPEPMRHKLDLKTGQALEVGLVDGTIVLKRAEMARAGQTLPAVADEKLPGEPGPIVDPALAVTLSPEMPDEPAQRKATAKRAKVALPHALRTRGRKPKE